MRDSDVTFLNFNHFKVSAYWSRQFHIRSGCLMLSKNHLKYESVKCIKGLSIEMQAELSGVKLSSPETNIFIFSL